MPVSLSVKGNLTRLLWCILIGGQLDHLTRHLVNGLHDLKHLIVCDSAVLIDIVQLECPWLSIGIQGPDLGKAGRDTRTLEFLV